MAGNEYNPLIGPEALYVTLASKMIKEKDFYRDLADARMTKNVIRETAAANNIDLEGNLDVITEEVSNFLESSSGHAHFHGAINYLTGPIVEIG